METVFRTATAQDMAPLWALLDREFIVSRGRAMSLRQRYPATYDLANAHHFHLARTADGALAAGLATRRFSWRDGGSTFVGAMLGAVCTEAGFRRQGIGSALLRWSLAQLQSEGVEFAVLWSARQDFYRHLGWLAVDGGVVGRATGRAMEHVAVALAAALAVERIPAPACDTEIIEAIRSQYLDVRVLRQAHDYAQQPIPVDDVELLLWRHARSAAYALVGSTAAQTIVYEMVGAETGFPALWQVAQARPASILVNDCRGSASFAWLSRHADIAWEDKQLAMWQPLAAGLGAADFARWPIPYFDRI